MINIIYRSGFTLAVTWKARNFRRKMLMMMDHWRALGHVSVFGASGANFERALTEKNTLTFRFEARTVKAIKSILLTGSGEISETSAFSSIRDTLFCGVVVWYWRNVGWSTGCSFCRRFEELESCSRNLNLAGTNQQMFPLSARSKLHCQGQRRAGDYIFSMLLIVFLKCKVSY